MSAQAKVSKDSIYIWEGKNKNGQSIKGELHATSIAVVKADLRRQGIIARRVKRKQKPLFESMGKSITQSDITLFSRQMATMMNSGIPLVQSFDIVAKGLENPKLEKLLMAIKHDVEAGTTLAIALKKHPKFFNDLFCNLVDAGEQSGSLDIMLDKVATYKEKIESIKAKIKKALFYPAAVMLVAFAVTAGLLIFVVPQFESLFKGFGADLPVMTQVVIEASEFFQAYWWMIFGIMGGCIFAAVKARERSPRFAKLIDQFSLRIPILGPILKKGAIARFTRTLSITFAAGLPLVDALKAVSGATGNILFAEASMAIREQVTGGTTLQQSMRNTQLFPNMVTQMVAIGEESGSLESMLSKSADFFEAEVDNAVDALSSLLEPFIMVILGTLVGGLVIAMYLPIFKLGSVV